MKRRQQCEEQRVTCSSLETALQASKVQDDLLASQLRAAQHLLHCEQLETQALSQQVWPPAADWTGAKSKKRKKDWCAQPDVMYAAQGHLATGWVQTHSVDLHHGVVGASSLSTTGMRTYFCHPPLHCKDGELSIGRSCL